MRSRPAISASGRSACQWKVKCQTSSVLHVSSIVSPIDDSPARPELTVRLRSGLRALPPHDAARAIRVPTRKAVRDHPPDIVPDHMHLVDTERVEHAHQIRRQDRLAIPLQASGAGRVSCSAVVRRDDAVPPFRQRRDDMAELVRCLREAVDEQQDALLGTLRRAVDVEDGHFIGAATLALRTGAGALQTCWACRTQSAGLTAISMNRKSRRTW